MVAVHQPVCVRNYVYFNAITATPYCVERTSVNTTLSYQRKAKSLLQ